MLRIRGDHRRLQEPRRTIGAAHEDIGPTTVAKSLEYMGSGQQVALFVNEEPVAKKAVAITARGCGLVQLINDGTDGGRERGIVGRVLRRGAGRKAAKETAKESCKPKGVTFCFLTHCVANTRPWVFRGRWLKGSSGEKAGEDQKEDR